MRTPAVMFWSGGKDSALALWEVQRAAQHQVVALLTTLDEEDRTGMHRIRRELIETQAQALGLPVHFIRMPAFPPNAIYEDRVRGALLPFLQQGVRCAVFGDLFLTEIRAYRERMLLPLGVESIYPLWLRDTKELAREFIAAGFEARLVCVDTAVLNEQFAGRKFDEALLRELPETADPCGENGEFHTFVSTGPIFRRPLTIAVGGTVRRDRFVYRDLDCSGVPVDSLR